ncbi:MAG: tetratricopeptide repeat protein [Holophagales bacterium]|nr:tetratricopeptide repeat protein [Holophagales bacterium]
MTSSEHPDPADPPRLEGTAARTAPRAAGGDLPTEAVSETPSELAWRGVELCRSGNWPAGLHWLCLAGRIEERSGAGEEELPALFYSYLGYGMARYRNQQRLGLVMCRNALQLELYQPEAYYFLAKTLLLRDDRRSALEVIDQGLAVDPEHRQLQALQQRLGERKPPVVPFFARRHPLNRWLGRLRHTVLEAAPMAAPLAGRSGSSHR